MAMSKPQMSDRTQRGSAAMAAAGMTISVGILAPSFVGPAAQQSTDALSLRSHVRSGAQPTTSSAHGLGAELESAGSFSLPLLAGLTCAAYALCAKGRARTLRQAVRDLRSGGSSGFDSGYQPKLRPGYGSSDMEALAAVKQGKERELFDQVQERTLRMGPPPFDDLHWSKEERLLFRTQHVAKGLDFGKYENVDVERIGGQGEEEPLESFAAICEKYDLPKALIDNFERCGYDVPTPVQKHAIPAALDGTDVMVSAQTGSGKTAAFLTPIVATAMQALAKKKVMKQGAVLPTSVVLSPTRELCQQISEECRRLCFRSKIRIACIYGGADAKPQLRDLANGADIVIATPGRLSDFITRGHVSMSNVKYLALDEADRMLDMGFEPQIRQIIEEGEMPLPGTGREGRQTMMFSATFPQEMQDLALDFLDPSYMWIGVGKVGASTSMVEQRFEDVSRTDSNGKFQLLVNKLREVTNEDGEVAKTIIFANTKGACDDIASRLRGHKIRAKPIHGGLDQRERNAAIADLKKDRIQVLVATDVASRGLDVPGVDHVVNYELPQSAEDYVHRIGRTGRIGNKGVATAMVWGNEGSLRGIVEAMRDAYEADEASTPVPEWLLECVRGGGSGGGSRRR
mmetsp:Transcript_94122/g.304523  ORF Transcript_94122/g.304523 Transcript_94122/m.304523 type:complete len:629 (-) Transcript_94122:175-2061(-)